jgi:uncharacterized protein YjbI with pentapeptide repeats
MGMHPNNIGKMNKKIIENLVSGLPVVIKDIAKLLKDNFDENGKSLLEKSTGTAAILITLFGKPFVDKYFDELTEKKLDNYGLKIYLKAGFVQAHFSLAEIADKFVDNYEHEYIYNQIQDSLDIEFEALEKREEIYKIFHPQYHQSVVSVKRSYEHILQKLNTPQDVIDSFTKHFNQNIEKQVGKAFGGDHEKHLEDVKEHLLEDSEVSFLEKMVELGRIGFKEDEDLLYEETFASWKSVSRFKDKDENVDEDELESVEKKLKPIDELMRQYFDAEQANNLKQILFVIADFGKGKSVFLRYHAAKLARKYLQTGEGQFPVYFNLRDCSNYSSNVQFGVINDYFAKDFAIDINTDHFKKKDCVFLIDSLDESGELNKTNINAVVSSVKHIQSLDSIKCRNNQIVITSRPFDDGLEDHLRSYAPHLKENKQGGKIPQFISIHGFKKSQFNNWLSKTLKPVVQSLKTSGFVEEIITAVNADKEIDIHEKLLENGTLSASELRRPIFAYMIFKLIVNDVDFAAIGKIGIYLSFLNLLTREAKHVDDDRCIKNLAKEFEFRNILHATAALWMYERQQGKQGFLKKADLCRVLDGEDKSENDAEVLARYKEVKEVQFLSHSYFGENDNILHFQHQSFAEILLAEYYLKVFIKYALDRKTNIEDARIKLVLGEPTGQTVAFFTAMLNLLKETVVGTDKVLEKRKLLFPLMASLATDKYNKLFCDEIFYTWYKEYEFGENTAEYPSQALDNWCIDQAKLDKIVQLAQAILESADNYTLAKTEVKTALYANELRVLKKGKLNDFPPDIDRWLALLVGNTLYNDGEKFFNGTIKNFRHLFYLIANWNYFSRTSAPNWGEELFQGIDMKGNNEKINLNYLSFDGLNFSNSYLKNISAYNVNMRYINMSNCSFESVQMARAILNDADLSNIIFSDDLGLDFTSIGPNVLMPITLANRFSSLSYSYPNCGSSKTYLNSKIFHRYNSIFKTLKGAIVYALKEKWFNREEVIDWFEFDSEKTKKRFLEKAEKMWFN